MNLDEAKRIILTYHYLMVLNDTDSILDFDKKSFEKTVEKILKELSVLDGEQYLGRLVESMKREMERR